MLPFPSLNEEKNKHGSFITTENDIPKYLYVIGGKTQKDTQFSTILEFIDISLIDKWAELSPDLVLPKFKKIKLAEQKIYDNPSIILSCQKNDETLFQNKKAMLKSFFVTERTFGSLKPFKQLTVEEKTHKLKLRLNPKWQPLKIKDNQLLVLNEGGRVDTLKI